jgi:glycosyltransferase involved in cell wall biosynthesis
MFPLVRQQMPTVAAIQRSPRVSVILTVYKRTNFLIEALESALAQSYGLFEVIVADDSGTAASRGIVDNYISDNVLYLPNPTTIGIARSLVQAVQRGRGELIAVLNDDDVWEKTFLAELVAPFEEDPDCVASFSDHSVMDKSGQINSGLSDAWSASAGRATLPAGKLASPAEFAIRTGGIPIANAAVFRKASIDWSLVEPQVSGAYDYWISCLLAAKGGAVYYVPKRLARYRVHGEMETHRQSHDKGENLVYIFDTILTQRWFPVFEPVVRRKLAEALLVVGRDKLHFDRRNEARRFFWRSFLLRIRPLALIGIAGTFLPPSLRKRLWTRLTTATRIAAKSVRSVEN